jgi:two-component SAPR family response regulator
LRVLGPVEPINRDHSEVVFRKAKSIELLCWLAFHRDRPTIAGARTALWEIDVRDATFHNVLSELRRGLASTGINNAVGRKTKHRLYLDEQIITDGDLLRAVLHSSERRAATVAVSELCGVLQMVRGLPFAAANYAWADAEGITSTLYWLVTRSIERVAALVETDRDKSALFEAAAAGLRMSPGDEAFTRLQSHALVRS